MPDDLELTSQHWDEFTARYSGRNAGIFWWEVPEVMSQINRRISGDPEVDWFQYTLHKYFAGRLPIARTLSLGCGTGEGERRLAELGAFQQCDAYDLSGSAILEARKAAEAAGLDHIRYQVADVNALELPKATYDIVWAYGAMHHFANLEHVIDRARGSLKPDGLLAMNEYVGPARFQFPERQKEIANLCLKLLPERYRVVLPEAVELEAEQARAKASREHLDPQQPGLITRILKGSKDPAPEPEPPEAPVIRTEVGFPSAADVVADDPSESVRSNEILKVLEKHFEIVEKIAWGGNILQFLLSGIAGNFSDDDKDSQLLIRMLWQIEEVLLQCGELKSDFAYIVARPLHALRRK
ncbi:MAG: class I SAM-dependent methyltransferase [Acidobacteriota bacterium]